MKIASWNVNGIRSCKDKGLLDYLHNSQIDILCLQETKAEEGQLSLELSQPAGFHAYFNSSRAKKGYSGVAIYSRTQPVKVWDSFSDERFNSEGRILWADYNDFLLLNLYFPNGQKDDERLQFKLDFNQQLLRDLAQHEGRKILVCGDYNTAHSPIDLKNPKANEKYSGFLPIERAFMDQFCALGYVDTYRHFYPDKVQYSWWTYRMGARQRNIGWRIDYFFANQAMMPCVKSASIEDQIMGSDHCPVTVTLAL